MAKQFSRVVATGLLSTGLVLSAVAISGASGRRERTIHCRSSTYPAKGHRYTPSHMVFALDGHPSCSDARAMIRTRLGSHRDHTSDSNFIRGLQGGKLLLSGSRIPTHLPLARFGRLRAVRGPSVVHFVGTVRCRSRTHRCPDPFPERGSDM